MKFEKKDNLNNHFKNKKKASLLKIFGKVL